MIGRLLVAVLMVVFATAAYASENLLPNPGFEVLKGDTPEGWYPIGVTFSPAGPLTTDTAVKRSGERSLLMRFDPALQEKPAPIQVSCGADGLFRGGTTYTYSTYVKTQNVGSVKLQLYEYPAPFPPSTIHDSTSVRGDNDWTRLSITFTARPDIGGIQVRCGGWPASDGSVGKVWFDDGKLEEGAAPTDYDPKWVTEYYGLENKKPQWFPVPFDFEATAEHETPHIAPSKVKGAPDTPVLFAMWWGRMRLVSELIQRMNIATSCVAINGRPNQGYIIHENCALRLREQLAKNPRVYVTDSDAWEGLISKDRSAVEQRVQEGMGLVFVQIPAVKSDSYLKKFLDRCAKPQTSDTYTYGKGKVQVHIFGRPLVSAYEREADFDGLVRSIRTVSNQPAAAMTVAIDPIVPDTESSWKLNVKSAAAANRLIVTTRPNRHAAASDLESLGVEAVDRQEIAYAPDATVAMPPLPAGQYFAEIIAVDAQGAALAWHLEPFAVDGKLRIWSVKSEQPLLSPDRSTVVTLKVECSDQKPRRIELRSVLRDGAGRLIAPKTSQQALANVGQTDVALNIKALPAASPVAWLEVELLADGRKLDAGALRLCSESLQREPDFFFGFYIDHPEGSRKLGADTMVESDAANYGFRALPWIDVMPYKDSPKLPLGEHDVTNPQTIAKASELLTATLRENLPHKTVGVILIDEWHNDYGNSPTELAYFKTFLKETYGSIDKLNTYWQTSHASFDAVTFETCNAKAITKGASPVAWADMQCASERAVADFVAALEAAGKKVDPDVRMGFSGTRDTKADNGLDWHALMKSSRLVATYGGVHTRLEESFRRPGTRIMQWSYPTETNVSRARYDPWRDMLRQRQGYLHYSGAFTNMFMPDHRPHPAGEAIAQEVEAIRRGPARLINGSKWNDYGIAVLYDTASYRASRIAGWRHGSSDCINDVLYATDTAITDARLFCKFVAPEHLDAADFRVLYLGYAQTMSDASVAAVRRFVERGGVVIADLRPAVMDERCRDRAAGALDDLFGIAPRRKIPTLGDGQFKQGDTTFSVNVGEMDLAPTTAKALGKVIQGEASGPALLVRDVGKGKAILLNCAFPRYKKYRAGGIGGEVGVESADAAATAVRDLLASILAEYAGIRPVASLTDAAGISPRYVWVSSYRDGELTYLSLLPDREDPLSAKRFDMKVALAGPAHVYDQRRGKYLGKIDRFDLTVQQARAELFALLPYEVKAVQVDAPRQVSLGQSVKVAARVEASTGSAGRHVFVGELVRPDGTSRRWDRITFESEGGAIPIAIDDPAGAWQLIVTDAATGRQAKTTLSVVAP